MNETAKKLVGLFGDKSLTAAQFSDLIKDMKFGDLESGEYISTAKHTAELSEVQKTADAYKTQLETLKGEVETLSKSKGDIEALKKQQEELVAKHTAELAQKEKELANKSKMFAVKTHLGKAGAKDIDLAYTALALDLEKVEVKDDNVIGLAERVAELQKNKDFLFNATTPPNGKVGGNGKEGTEGDKCPDAAFRGAGITPPTQK